MDAALWELLEEGESEDEIAAIIRLGQPGSAPPGVRLVAQFGHIATCRLKRGAITPVRADEAVASFKAPRTFAPEQEVDDPSLENLPESFPFVDERRPPHETATGRGVVVGVVDWGCDFAHEDFRREDGSTRLLALWDQRAHPELPAPSPYGYGVVHTPEAINKALADANPYATLNYHPADADTGRGAHGTHVLGIAAGNGRAGGPMGVAPGADIIFVHSATLASEKHDKLGDSVTLLEAVDFIARVAGERPWVINLSMGRHGEPHDGSTLVEQGLDQALRAAPGRAIVQSTGNYFSRRIHSAGQLRPAEERTLIWQVEEVDPTPNQLEIWYSGLDNVEVELLAPVQTLRQSAKLGQRATLSLDGREVGRIYHRGNEPNNLSNHVEIFLYEGAPAGEWQVTLKGRDIVDGRYHAWIERDAACPSCQSSFSVKDSVSTYTTGTICNGFRTIAVGAYNPHSAQHELAPFSSSGPTRDGRLKPDLVAPGVRILAARSAPRESRDGRSLLTRMSGTSMAAPYVAGTVALMFEVAGRRLRIEETHNLLLASTRKVETEGADIARMGSGYCDIARAVRAARTVIDISTRRGIHELTQSEAKAMKQLEYQDALAMEAAIPFPVNESNRAEPLAGNCDTFEAENEKFAQEDEPQVEGIPSSRLQWRGASSEQLDFMRRVYEKQVRSVARTRRFIADIPAPELDVIEGHQMARISTAADCRELLSQARGALSQQQRDGVPQALAVGSIHIASAYRSASQQFNGWQRAFPRYYAETQTERASRTGGEHGEAAAEFLVSHIHARLAAPGYSLHNNGLAVDFGTQEQGRSLGPSTSRESIRLWRVSWLFHWMMENAARWGFSLNTRINEPWHWEHRSGERLAGQREADYFREYDAEAVNVERAVRLNRGFAQSLGWQAHYERLNQLLGFTNNSPGEEDFALAVGRWQRGQSLTEDGVIGPGTWARISAALGLTHTSAPPLTTTPAGARPATASAQGASASLSPAEEKALRLTNAFENTTYYSQHRALDFGGLSGDFDQQGLSFGLLQWNFGTGTLQPLLRDFADNHSQSFDRIFGTDAAQFRQVLTESRVEQMSFIRSINDYTNRRNPRLIEPWSSYFRRLADDPEFQQIQLRAVRPRMNQAINSARHFGLRSERGLAFMFDMVTQNGGGWLSIGTRNTLIQQQRTAREHELGRTLTEIELLTIIANVVADSARPQYRENVRRRRMTIVNGQGVVHGHRFNLEVDFGITDQPWETAPGGTAAGGRTEQDFEDYFASLEYDEMIASADAAPGEFAENVTGGEVVIDDVPLLRSHRGTHPDLILRWNDMDGAPAEVDVVVHLHGYSSAGANMNLRSEKLPYSGLNFSDPTNRAVPGRLRPTLCIMPRGNFLGGERHNAYNFPALTTSTGLRRLIDYSLNRFAQEVSLPQVQMRRLIITAHSGGGAALRDILRHNDPQEVHIFDALYSDPARLIQWAQNHLGADQMALGNSATALAPEQYMRERGGALRVFYLPHTGTAAHSLAVQRAISNALADSPSTAQTLGDWYRVEAVSHVGHNGIPRAFGWRVLADASANVPNVSPPGAESDESLETDVETEVPASTLTGMTEDAHSYVPFEAQLVEQADEAINAAPQRSISSQSVLGGVLEQVVGTNPFGAGEQLRNSLSPAALFEAFAYDNNPAMRQHFEPFFEVVALPRSQANNLREGDILLRRALGEGGFTHVSMLSSGETLRAEDLAVAGIRPESARAGHYATVLEAGAFPHSLQDRFARRISDESGLLGHDSLLLRIRGESHQPFGRASLLDEAESDSEVVETFSAVAYRDMVEWASVMHYDEDVRLGAVSSHLPPLPRYHENPIPNSADFHPYQQSIFTALNLMRPVTPPSWGGPNYEFKLKSRVYYPRGSRAGQLAGTRAFPVVIIVHGNHVEVNAAGDYVDTENHLGYEYLQRELARHGIVSMSINTNQANLLGSDIRTRAEFVVENVRILHRYNTRRGDMFENRLDLTNIGLLGHSRGGDAVVKAAMMLRGNPNFTVKAVCSLAPTDNSAEPNPVRPIPSDWNKLLASDHLRYLVLYGSHDGDVSGLFGSGTGFRHYDRAECDRTLIFVKGITHNRFNTKWNNQRHYGDPTHRFVSHPACTLTRVGAACPPFDTNIRSADDHHQLANEYIGGLFRLELNGETSRLGLFNGLIVPTRNYSVSIQWMFTNMLEIENFDNPGLNKLGGASTYTATSQINFKHGSTPPFSAVPHETWALQASTSGGIYHSEIPPAYKDFSSFTALFLRVANAFDVTSRHTIDSGHRQNFKVRIFFFVRASRTTGVAEANQSHLDTRGVRAPNRPFFHEIEDGGTQNVTKICFDTLVIPLRHFSGVNWRNVDVTAIEFEAGPGLTSIIFVDSLAVA